MVARTPPKPRPATRSRPHSTRSAKRPKQPYHHGDLARALVTAAEQLLAERGPEGFTLRECARRAGVSHAAPTHHFADVTGLLTEVAAAGFERLAENTRRARESAAAPADQLLAVMQAYVDTAVAHPATFRLMFASHRVDPANPRFSGSGAAAYAVLVETVQSLASASGRSVPTPYSPEVTLTWSAAHGFASLLVEKRLERGTAAEYGGNWRARSEATLRLFVNDFARRSVGSR